MSISLLNHNQSSEELNRIYVDDYYWYLNSPEFHKAFLEPIGKIVNEIGGACLDVGCGEGQLARHVRGSYLGIDGSKEAITKALANNPTKQFKVARLEDYNDPNVYDSIVFGGILSVTIRPESRVQLLVDYVERFAPEYLIVYDLETLDASGIDKEFSLVKEIRATANVEGLQEVKKHRKIRVYKC